MGNINSIILEGNVVRDSELRETAKGVRVCTFSVASNRVFQQNMQKEKEVSFFDIECWGKLAEICGTNCPKGRGVRVIGRLKQDRWVGTDGKNHSRIKIVAEHVEFKPQVNKTEMAAEQGPPIPDEDDMGTGGEITPVF
ncbi:MAG: single-stranded DNA-binding protein [Lachnoclostridium sp.]|nr:single-stranded DNA-binding protein [Lachnoclostridium sp.]